MSGVHDYEFFGVLKSIANSLQKINENLSSIREIRHRETEQYLKESRYRLRNERRTLINESKGKNGEEKIREMLSEYKIIPTKSVNNAK